MRQRQPRAQPNAHHEAAILPVFVDAHGDAIGAKGDRIDVAAQVSLYLAAVSGDVLANAFGQLKQTVGVHGSSASMTKGCSLTTPSSTAKAFKIGFSASCRERIV